MTTFDTDFQATGVVLTEGDAQADLAGTPRPDNHRKQSWLPATPRWYFLNADGMATLCADEADAKECAQIADKEWPTLQPHKAVQLVEYTAQPAPVQEPGAEDRSRVLFERHWRKTRGPKKSGRELTRHPLQPQTYIQDSANRHWVTWQAALKSNPPAAPVQPDDAWNVIKSLEPLLAEKNQSWALAEKMLLGTLGKQAEPEAPAVQGKREDGMPSSSEERYLRRLPALHVGIPGTYYDDGEAYGQQFGVSIDFMRESAADIDAKLRALTLARLAQDAAPEAQRQHVTDGSPCWCNPDTDCVDPENGVAVIVHKEPS